MTNESDIEFKHALDILGSARVNRQVLSELPVPAAIIDHAGRFYWRNHAWANLDPIYGIPFVWPLDFFAKVIRCCREDRRAVLRGVPLKDTDRSFDIWIGPVANFPERAWLMAADVTVYEREATRDLVDKRVREASVMIQGILHEMRNPLAGIKGTVQLLQRRKTVTGIAEDLDQILADVSRIDAVFQELTILAGGLKLRRQMTNLHAVIDDAIGNNRGLAESRGVVFKRTLDPSLPEVNVDPDRMYRVYLNLLRNAVDASPDGGTIEIVTRVDHSWRLLTGSATGGRRSRTVWVSEILNQGGPIGQADLDMLFTPLYTTKSTGTGLGLPVSLQIVQAHGGILTLANRASGDGAIATVALPLDSPTAEGAE